MKTLKEIKEEYAKNHKFKDWIHMLRHTGDWTHERMINDIAQQYAREVAKEALKNAQEKMDEWSESQYEIHPPIDMIIDESNIPTL